MSNSTATVEPQTVELLDVDPGTLIVGANVRTDTQADAKDFARSIKTRGVLTVIDAYRDEDGALVVLTGQRRTVVAAEVGTPTGTVPVRVLPAPDEADRIVDQLSENLHRAEMHQSEVTHAVEQLSLLNVSAAQIAKRTALPRKAVDTTLSVVGSAAAREAYTSGQVSLDEAAILAEFDGDDEAMEFLAPHIESGHYLAHYAQQLRDKREIRATLQAEVERLRGEGLPVLDVDETPEDLHYRLTMHLRGAEGERVPEDEWPSIEGAAIVLDYGRRTVEHQDEDGETVYRSERGPVQRWIVTDPEAAGLVHYSEQETDRDGAPLSEADAEAKREAEKVERRKVREFNKAWRAAETVRRTWLREFFARKSAPTGAEALISEAVLTQAHQMTKASESRHKMLLDILGEKHEGYYGNPEACRTFATTAKTPKGMTMRTLAAVVAAWEGHAEQTTWRNPSEWDARVLGALIEWGYEASPVERILIGESSDLDQVAVAA